jgi:hypothetical protein
MTDLEAAAEDGYPLLRPDRLAHLGTRLLLRAQADVAPLLAGAAGAELAAYAARQHALVGAELLRRDARAHQLQLEQQAQAAAAAEMARQRTAQASAAAAASIAAFSAVARTDARP